MAVLPEASSLPIEKLERILACPNCQCADSHLLFMERGFPTMECDKCGFIFLGLRLKEEHLGLIYDNSGYHSVQNSNFNQIVGRKRLALLPNLAKGSRIHEDGAGNGAFVLAAKNGGLVVTGNDLGQDSINKAKAALNVDLANGTLLDVHLKDGELDALASFNLLCHLYDPWSYFQEVQRVLKKSGYFLIRVGNRQGYFKRQGRGKWGAPEHIYHFGLGTLRPMLEKAGLKINWVKPAFDSDFPYLFFNFRTRGKTPIHKLAGTLCGISVRLWTLLGLPKDDVYILAQKD